MKHLKNEKGYTLAIVLLVIMLMFPIATMLLVANTNSSQQLQRTEDYNSSIAMAEMGIVFADEKIEHILQSELSTAIERYGTRADAELLIYTYLADRIEARLPVIQSHDNQSYSIQNVVATPLDDGINLTLSSLGTADGMEQDYQINFSMFLASNIADLIENNENDGGGEIPSPGEIPPPQSDWRNFQTVMADIEAEVRRETAGHSRAGETFEGVHEINSRHYTSATTIRPGASLTVNGSIFAIGWNANDANLIDIRGSFFNSSGGTNISRIPRVNIERHLGSSQALTFSDTNLTVNGEMALANPVTIDRSDVTLNGYIALNRIAINDSIIRVQDARPSELIVTDSEMIVRGSLMIEWGGSRFTRSDVRVWGHLIGNSPLRISEGTTFTINGDANFTTWDSIIFEGNGSRVIVFGNLTFHNQNTAALVERVDRLVDCPVIPNANRICWIAEDPPLSGGNDNSGNDNGAPGDGSGNDNQGSGTINDGDVNWNTESQEINYEGLR